MAKKDRNPVPEDVATLLMFRSNRTCCVCHERGEPIRIHHIDEDPSNNDPDNLAVLCFHCHDETQIRGGFGCKLDAAQVTYFHDDWHRRVEARREAADKIALAREAGHTQATAPTPTRRDALPDPAKLTNYIRTLPAVRKDIYGRSKTKWDSGNTPQMKQGSYDVIDVLEQILVTLATWYPPGHFGGREPRDYINAVTASRFTWHRAPPGTQRNRDWSQDYPDDGWRVRHGRPRTYGFRRRFIISGAPRRLRFHKLEAGMGIQLVDPHQSAPN